MNAVQDQRIMNQFILYCLLGFKEWKFDWLED